MDWEYVILGTSIFLIIIIITVITLSIIKRKNRVNLHLNTAYGDIDAVGAQKDYVIEVDKRYIFLVHKGEITSFQDKEVTNHMTDYVGGDITC